MEKHWGTPNQRKKITSELKTALQLQNTTLKIQKTKICLSFHIPRRVIECQPVIPNIG